VPRWLALAPALFFGGVGAVLIGIGILQIGLMAYYNIVAGEIVRSSPDRQLWGPLMLTPANFLHLLWTFAIGAASFRVGISWMHDESARALRLTFVLLAFFFVGSGLIGWAKSVMSGQPVINAPPPPAIGAEGAPGQGARDQGARDQGARDQGARGQAPAFPAQPPRSSNHVMVVTIFLDQMTDAERARNEQVLKGAFVSLSNYVPDSVRIGGNTLFWRARIMPQALEQHKAEAIAILRRNNVRLSEFSEWWLKGQGGKSGSPVPLSRPPFRNVP
jgi:hypothetical protein